MNEKIFNDNIRLLNLTANFLNDPVDIKDFIKEDDEFYYKVLFATLIGVDLKIDSDKNFFYNYLAPSIKKLDVKDYIDNPYIKRIKPNNKTIGNIKLEYESYKPYEAFIYDSTKIIDDKQILSIGYFSEEFKYLTIKEDNNIWMLLTPNEINTMAKPIANARGKVLSFGLGLGYFQYMASLKDDVKEIIIVEKNKDIIKIFKELILNEFEYQNKITIIEDDLYHFIDNNDLNEYDDIFIDIWRDVSMGNIHYQKIRSKLNNIKCHIDYWIEDNILIYLLNEYYFRHGFSESISLETLKNKKLALKP